MLIERAQLMRNYEIVKLFEEKYPEEIKEMSEDIGRGLPKSDKASPLNGFLLNSSMCDKLKDVLDGKMPIHMFMLLWNMAYINTTLGINI